jgi:lysophospholipase L1-like esterase
MKRLTVRRRATLGAFVSIIVAATGVALATPALAGKPGPAPAPKTYVALGDSYSSGVGTGSYLNDGTTCQRSVYAYPSLDAAALGLDLDFRACSGAKVADVLTVQVPTVPITTNFVTVSVGGNDAGFADVVSTCAGSDTTACLNATNGAQSFITTTLQGTLTTLYGSIKAQAPNAKVIVVGYPRLFNGSDCSIWTSFTTAEMTALNATADLLNAVTATAAAGASAVFADPTQKFTGHAVCDGTPWINNVNVLAFSESYHPNRAGHRDGYAALTQPLFGISGGKDSKPRSAAEAVAIAEASADELARDAARYATVDRSITPESFSLRP